MLAFVSIAELGVPLFIAEIANKSTAGNDLGFKKEVYEFARVPEYITFDAAGHLITPALHAWRLAEEGYVPWVASDDGWWRSHSLGITFQPTQPYLTICDRDGQQISLPRQALQREYQVEQLTRVGRGARAHRGDGDRVMPPAR